MADFTVSTDVDTFMQSADKAAMRTNMDLGTAATKDVAATGDAASGEVVKGDDTRLTDARTPTSHTHTASEVTDFDTEVANNTTVAANTSKLAGIEAGAEVNNISDVNATDLTDGGDSSLHYHSADRNRSNHTGTQTLSTISDAGTIASQNANSVNITGGSVTGITDLAIADGGTGAGTAAGARTNLDVYSTDEVDEKVAPLAAAGGVAFDGAVGYAVLGVDVSSLFSSPFSLTWTYKPLSSPSSGTRIFQFGTSNNSNLNTASSTQFELFLNTDGTDGRYRWPHPTDYTKYYTFTLVIDPSDITSPVLYRDGVLQTRTTQNTPTGNVLVPSGDITCFGPVVFNNAQIRNLTIFNRALTASEVADLYRDRLPAVTDRWGVPGGATGCIAHYPMDEGIGYQIHDISSNHYDGLLSTSGFTHLVPKTEGYIRDFGVDAYNGGSGNAQLINSSRYIVPETSTYTNFGIINRGGSAVATSGIIIEATGTGGSNPVTVASFGTANLGTNANVSADISRNQGKATSRSNLQIDAASVSTATDLDIRVDYKLL